METSDKFLDSMKEVIDTWKEVPQTIQVIDKEVTAKPGYISSTYKELDTEVTSFLNGRSDGRPETEREEGYSVRVMTGDEHQGYGMAYIAREDFPRNPDALKELMHASMDVPVKSAFQSYLGLLSKTLTYDMEAMFQKQSKEEAEQFIQQKPEDEHLDSKVLNRIKKFSKEAYKQDYIDESSGVVTSSNGTDRFVDSEGRHIRTYNRLGHIILSGSIKHEKGQEESHAEIITFTNGSNITIDNLEEKIDSFFNYSEQLKSAKTPISNQYPVIMSGEALGTMVHEALGGHLLSARYIVDGTSTAFKGRIGTQVLPEFISIIDNPLSKGASGFYQFDDEGIRAQKTTLIQNGILKDYLFDRFSAAYLNTHSNGHARMEWVSNIEGPLLPEPRVSNLEIISHNTVSDSELEEVAKQYCINTGQECALYIESGAGEVQPETSEFRLSPSKAWKIFPDGKREAVNNFIVVGNAYELLRQIQVTSDTYKTEHGICGSTSGGVPTQEIAPAAFIPRVNIQAIDTMKYKKRLLPNK